MLLVHEKCGTSPSELQELMVDILCHYQVREYADIVFGFIGGGGEREASPVTGSTSFTVITYLGIISRLVCTSKRQSGFLGLWTSIHVRIFCDLLDAGLHLGCSCSDVRGGGGLHMPIAEYQ